jgi:predicted MFS family arabinose efflux permease
MVANLDRVRTGPSVPALLAINSVLVVGTLSFGIFPLLVDGLVRLAHLDGQGAGLCVTAEMVGQAVGAAGVLALQRRIGSRPLCSAALVLILFGNALTMGATGSLPALLVMRAVAGTGCGLTAVCIGLFATTKQPERNFAIYNAAAITASAVLAAAAPLVYLSFGIIGIFAVIGGAAGLCLMMVPFIPESANKATVREAEPAQSNVSLGRIALTCIITASYFISTSMFWSYAGQIGAWHHLDVRAVSSAVASAWLVGGLLGSTAAIPTARRVSRTVIVVACAAGGALATYASVIVGSPGNYSVVLHGFVFLWFLLYPIQMGIFSEVDASGQLATVAFLVQLIAFAIGPALGGLILRSGSYSTFGSCCGIGYVVFICATLILLLATNKSAQHASALR